MATTKVSTKLLETVGVAEGGTGAVSASAARTALGLVIGTNVLAPNGSAASLTNLPAGGASAAEAANIMVNSFNIAAAGGFAYQNMVDGVVDEFEDATGVDAPTSTNETYDAVLDLYDNSGDVLTSSIGDNYASTTKSNFSFGTGTVDKDNDTDSNINTDGTTPITFTGDFELSWTQAIAGDSATVVGVYAIAEDGTYNETDGSNRGDMDSMTNSWWFDFHIGVGRRNISYGGTVKDTFDANPVDDDTFKITRIGSTFYAYKNGTLVHTFADTSSAEVRVHIGSNDPLVSLTGITFYDQDGSTVNMTLVSNATTALAAPDDANIVIWQQDVTAITLNSDLKAYASRNGGTTYTQITLAEVADLTTGRILTGTVDISGQSSATAMKYKIETLNTKTQKIHAVALQWS